MSLKNISIFLNLINFLIVLNAQLRSNTTKLFVSNIVGRNMTLRLKHFTEQKDFEWHLIDIFTNQAKKINLTNSSLLNIFYRYWDESNAQKYSFHFNQLTLNNSGKILAYLSEKNDSKNIIFSFNTLVFENPKCSEFKNNFEDEIKVLEVYKNRNYTFSCSILTRFNDENDSLAPQMSWEVEKKWEIFKIDAFSTQYSTITKLSGETIKFTRFLEYSVPDDDLEAWEHNNHPFFCNIRHNFFYHKDLKAINDTQFISTFPLPSKLPIQCKIQLNVQFKPFVHPNVNVIQVFDESYPALVECPIKANNHFPVKYYIVWYTNSENGSHFNLKFFQEYIGSADIYVIENPKYGMYHKSLVKCELYEIDQHHYHSEDYKKNIFLKFEKQKLLKKMKLLFSSIIRIEIIKRKWRNNITNIGYSGISHVNVFVICLIEFLVFFGIILFVIYVLRTNVSKKNSNFPKRGTSQIKKVQKKISLFIFLL